MKFTSVKILFVCNLFFVSTSFGNTLTDEKMANARTCYQWMGGEAAKTVLRNHMSSSIKVREKAMEDFYADFYARLDQKKEACDSKFTNDETTKTNCYFESYFNETLRLITEYDVQDVVKLGTYPECDYLLTN